MSDLIQSARCHPGGFADRAERTIGAAVEGVAALLLVAETTLLFAGVVARYVFHNPIVWSDELAGAIFLWLSMLGAVVALRRGEHMCFAALAERASPQIRATVQALVLTSIAATLILLLRPALDYVEDESFATMPNLGVPSSWRVLGIVVGLVLMLAVTAVQIVKRTRPVHAMLAFAIAGAVGAGLWLASPFLLAIGNLNLIVFFVVLVAVSIAVGIPIAFAFAIATVAYLGLMTHVPLSLVINRLDQGMSQPLLLAIPMFIFLGLLIEVAGLARAMITLLSLLLGSVRGGMYYVLLAAMILISGISGSKAADMAAVAPGLFPEMKRRGANDGDLVALLAASAAMADTIPPSLVLITLGSVTGISIASLFTAGLIPALVLAGALAILIFVRSRNDRPAPSEIHGRGVVPRAVALALPALILPFVIRTAVVEGIATATEVSTIGIAYTLLAGLTIYRPFQWRRCYPLLVETAALSASILFVIGAANGMAWALTQSGFSSSLTATMQDVAGGRYGFLAITIVVFVLLGNILEGIPAILLFAPLLLPVSHSFGIDGVHYAMVVVIAMSIGLFAPPFGVGFYAACAIGRVAPNAAASHVWRYLAVLTLALVLIAAVPWFSTALL
ncbi:TRAP transporter large permease subunit [Bradyrhizobium sp. McL0616]|uniref:TRAP transporter large permease n=1 Tax=Bradyrhizobium sp. McL0616 TaxID=3415674 RepID=UPI003CEBF08C